MSYGSREIEKVRKNKRRDNDWEDDESFEEKQKARHKVNRPKRGNEEDEDEDNQ